MSHDPFAPKATDEDIDAADVAAEDAPKTPAKAKTTTKKETRPVSNSNEGKVVVTLKGGSSYAAPWVVIHADDVQDALSQLSGDDATVTAELLTRTAAVAKYFQGEVGEPVKSGGGERTAGKPAGATQEPSGQTRDCSHGSMQYRAAKEGSGKNWRGFFCPTPQGTPDQCKPVFLKS